MTTNFKSLKDLIDIDAADRVVFEEKLDAIKRDIDLAVKRDSSGAFDYDAMICLIKESIASDQWTNKTSGSINYSQILNETLEKAQSSVKENKEGAMDGLFDLAVYVKRGEADLKNINWIDTTIKPLIDAIADYFPGLDMEPNSYHPGSVFTKPLLSEAEKIDEINKIPFVFWHEIKNDRLQLYGRQRSRDIVANDCYEYQDKVLIEENMTVADIIEFLAPGALQAHLDATQETESNRLSV